jgi:two-component system, NarL family, sensor histidine kinase DesK
MSGRDAVLAVGGVTALAAATLALTDPESALFWTITGTVLATGTLWFLIGGILRSNAELREARAELAELAVAEERLRFARDMHDLLGHDLSLIALKAELAGKLLPARLDDAAAEVADIRTLSRSALTQVREAVDGYRRPTLPAELAGARVALEAAGIELSVDGPGETLDPELESVLAWAVREGATNVIRHSGAGRAEITVTAGAGAAVLEIADDGRGARALDEGANGTPGPGSNAAREPAGHGLAGLIERAHALGGTVEAAADPDGGFRLRVSVPAREREIAA